MATADVVPQLMRQCRNYFVLSRYEGEVKASGGQLKTPVPDANATWVAVEGQGIYPADSVPDYTGTAVVWMLRPPEAFLRLCADVDAWQESGGTVTERLGDYSVTKERAVLDSRIACWRRMFAPFEL